VATTKTWIWIIAACLGLCIVALAAIAGLGIYFVASNISTGPTSSADALRAFDEIRREFRDERPLFELDSDERPRPTRHLRDLPTSPHNPQHLWILAWDPDEERLSRISLPFWMLRLGDKNLDFRHDGGFDLQELDLDFAQLERVGPVLIFDLRTPDGERVLVWTR